MDCKPGPEKGKNPSNGGPPKGLTPNRAIALFLLIFAGALAAWLIPNHISGYTTGAHGLSPRFFPYLITIVIALLSLVLLLKDLSRPEGRGSRIEDKRLTKATGLTMSVLVGYYLLMRYIGMVPASLFACILLIRLFGFRRWWIIFLFSAVFVLVLFFFFEKVAQVPMPRGIWLDGVY